MQTTTSIIWNKGLIAREHNRRDIDLCINESHIDINNVHGDSVYESWLQQDIKDAYADIFGDAIEEYNKKQKQKCRRLSVDKYIDVIEKDTRGKEQTKIVNGKRVVDKDALRKGKQVSYEFTVKVGNTEREHDDNGKVIYDANNHHIRPYELPRELQKIIFKKYIETFPDENPNLRLINVDFHADEGFYNKRNVWEYSEDHLHVEIVPIATGFKQGLSIQNSMNKAMAEMGFDSPDCYHEWASKEQDRLAEITREEYAKYCKEHPDFEKSHGDLEIIHPVRDKLAEGGLTKEEYARKQELDEDIADAEYLLDNIRDESERIEEERLLFDNEKKTFEETKEEIINTRVEEDTKDVRVKNTRAKDELDKERTEFETIKNETEQTEKAIWTLYGQLRTLEIINKIFLDIENKNKKPSMLDYALALIGAVPKIKQIYKEPSIKEMDKRYISQMNIKQKKKQDELEL